MMATYQSTNITQNNSSELVIEIGQGPLDSGNLVAGSFFIVNHLFTYLLPVIVTVGYTGNLLSGIVFASKQLRKVPSSVYVLAVLSADTGVLTSLLMTWLEMHGYRIYHATVTCQLLVFLGYVFSFLSVWYIVCITLENYVTICYPWSVKKICTRRHAVCAVITLTAVSVISYTYSLFTAEVKEYLHKGNVMQICTTKSEMMLQFHILVYIDSVMTLFIPIVIMFYLLLAICLTVARSAHLHNPRQRSSLRDSNGRKRRIPQERVTRMLLLLSLSFLCLSVPNHALRLYLLWQQSKQQQASITMATVHIILQFVFYLNFCIKFFILICSKNFRKVLRSEVFIIRKQKRR